MGITPLGEYLAHNAHSHERFADVFNGFPQVHADLSQDSDFRLAANRSEFIRPRTRPNLQAYECAIILAG
jgi:chorismate-pyruvate lyase